MQLFEFVKNPPVLILSTKSDSKDHKSQLFQKPYTTSGFLERTSNELVVLYGRLLDFFKNIENCDYIPKPALWVFENYGFES